MPCLQYRVHFRESIKATTHGPDCPRVCTVYRPLSPNVGGWLISWVYPISIDRRLDEMEHEIEMVKATQREMQAMLSEVLTELRRGSGRPLLSFPTEDPLASSSNARMELPATQTSPSSSVSSKRLYTFL